jgi:hypothetical protein
MARQERLLRENGPMRLDELCDSGNHNVSVAARRDGARKFEPSFKTGSTNQLRAVWYLDKHNAASVIEHWLEANNWVIEHSNPRAVLMAINRCGGLFKSCSTSVLRAHWPEDEWSECFDRNNSGDCDWSHQEALREAEP